MEKTYKCALCKRDITEDLCVYKNNKYHRKCMELEQEKDNFYKLVCEIFHMQQPNPSIYNQVNNFFYKRPDYTFRGMSNALIYFYRILGKPVKPNYQTVGIIPYVYDEAAEYFAREEEKKKEITESLTHFLEKEEKINSFHIQEKKETKKLIDLDKLQ